MTPSPRWAGFRQLLREMFRADPRYHWESEWPTGPWKPPSEVPPLPAIPFVVDCKTMGVDPEKVWDGHPSGATLTGSTRRVVAKPK